MKLFGASHLIDDHTHSVYMRRYHFFGVRLWLHDFYRGDLDKDCHDHPWNFWTFPLHSYVEEYLVPDRDTDGNFIYRRETQVVKAFRLHFRQASYLHRILGRYSGNAWDKIDRRLIEDLTPDEVNSDPELEPCFHTSKRFMTIVWKSPKIRRWGFMKERNGKWCWTPWRFYVDGTQKHTPCED